MTNEENLEIQSTRYIAPRVMRLTSGRIAIIPMMGKGAPTVVDGNVFNSAQEELDALYAAIPTIDALETTYYSIRDEHRKRPSAAPAILQTKLEDLA